MKQKSYSGRVLLACSAGWILFIFCNSLMPGELSGNQSGNFLQLISTVFTKLGIGWLPTEFFIRKAAHFTEYAILGILLLQTYRHTEWFKRLGPLSPLFFALLVPVTDEAIQLFSDGRSGMVADIWIDFSGALFGMFLCLMIVRLCTARRDKRTLL